MEPFDTSRIPIRHHMLKALDRSPRHCLLKLKAAANGGEPAREHAVGEGAHALIFNTMPVVAAPMPRNEKHEAWRKFEAENAGCVIVTKSEMEKVQRLADAVRSHKGARSLLEATGVKYEETVLWEKIVHLRGGSLGPDANPITRTCRATPDIAAPDLGWLADLKCLEDANPARLPFVFREYDYASAAAWYAEAYATTADIECFFFLVVEKESLTVQVYEMDQESLTKGYERNLQRFGLFMDCEITGSWPGYANEDTFLPLKQAE